MSTPEEIEVGRRNLLAQLRHDLRRDLTEYPVDAATMRELVEVLEGLAPRVICGDTCEGISFMADTPKPTFLCRLPTGHTTPHRSVEGTSWVNHGENS